MFNFKKNNFGLTLIETTIALGILMIGILASLTLMLSSFNYVQQTEQEIIVVNLAREGIEIMRGNIRSQANAVCRSGSNQGNSCLFDSQCSDSQCVSALFTGDYDTNSYFIDNTFDDMHTLSYNMVTHTSASDCGECQLYLNNGQYTHNDIGDPTSFKRMVTINQGSNTDEKIILSEVSWTIKGKTYTYTLESHLTNWE